MTVYVDDMHRSPMGRLGRMKMSHMMADSRAELLAMADRIGLSRRWLQCAGQGRAREHFDVSLSARSKAVAAGAREVTMRELAAIVRRWREEDLATRGDDAGSTRKNTGRTNADRGNRAEGNPARMKETAAGGGAH